MPSPSLPGQSSQEHLLSNICRTAIAEMPASFLSLPAELRNEIYMHLLVRREPIDPWNGYHELVPNFLLTNTTILREARSLLYGHNCFDLTTLDSERIPEFLDTIGLTNASHLQCICIDFPRLRDLEDEVSLEEDSLHTLEKIQSHWTNLKTLIIASESTSFMENLLDSFDSPTICGKALALVAARFRAISSLQEIVVEVYEEGPSSDFRRKMQNHGWIFNVVEPVEEECGTMTELGMILKMIHLYDDYDIDNDSDILEKGGRLGI